jgi:hypothetical protein
VKIYERHLTVANGLALVVPQSENPNCFEIDFPHEALITKFVVKQNGGTPADFEVDLFNSPVCALGEPGHSESVAPNGLAEELARVMPQLSASAGAAAVYQSEDGYPFRNMVGTHVVPVRKIYVRINVDTPADDTVWEVAVGGLPKGCA